MCIDLLEQNNKNNRSAQLIVSGKEALNSIKRTYKDCKSVAASANNTDSSYRRFTSS